MDKRHGIKKVFFGTVPSRGVFLSFGVVLLIHLNATFCMARISDVLLGEEGRDTLSSHNPSPTPDLSDDTQLKLAKIRLHMEKGDYKKGLNQLRVIVRDNPNNPEILQMKASAENAIGKWPKALETVDSALKKFPKHPDLVNLKKDILKDRRSFIQIATEYKRVGSDRNEKFGFLKGLKRITNFTYLGFDFHHNSIYLNEVTRPKTGFPQSVNAKRQRGNIHVTHYFRDGHRLKGGVYAAPNIFGGHASLKFVDDKGSTTVGGKLREPDWDNMEAVIWFGTRDRLFMNRRFKLTDNTELTLEGGVNQYNVDGISSAVRTLSALLRLSHTFYREKGFAYIPGKKTGVTVSYNLDGDYPFQRKNRVNIAGTPFSPSSVSRSESHTFALYVSTYLLKAMEFSAFGGYTISRLERNNPSGGANLDLYLKNRVKLGLEYEHSVDVADRNEPVDRFRAKLKYMFD